MFAPIGPRPSSSNVTRLRLVLPWVLVLLVRTLGAQSSQTPFYMELPPNVLPYAVDASGWVSVGLRYNSTTGQYWMPATGTVDIGGLAGFAVSDDGKTIVGNALDSQGRENAAIWTGGKTWRLLGSFTADAQSCDRSYSSSYGATGDGRVVVGLAWDTCKIARAFRWEERTGVVSLGSLSGESTRANNISADGQVIVG